MELSALSRLRSATVRGEGMETSVASDASFFFDEIVGRPTSADWPHKTLLAIFFLYKHYY